MDKIKVENLSVIYSDGVRALDQISFNIPKKQITALIGPSGGGKSTLLRVFNRLIDLADVLEIEGKVTVDGVNILEKNIDVIALRRKIGIVFSRPLPLPLTIYENVSYGLEMMGEKRKNILDEEVERALCLAELWDEVKDRLNDPANSISGGQQQRLCLARTLSLKPDIILLDEPTSALDPVSTAKIESSLIELKKNYTVIIAPHNTQQAGRIADMIAFFLQGELVEFSTTENIFTLPQKKQTQDFISGKFG